MSHIFGILFSAKRYKSYKPYVSWQYHSKYKGLRIERAYIVDNAGTHHNKGLYRAYNEPTDDYIVGASLAEIKTTIIKFQTDGPGPVVSE